VVGWGSGVRFWGLRFWVGMGSELSGAGGRISERDLEVLGFVSRFGVVPRGAMALWAGTAKTMTWRRERRLRDAGLLEVHRSLWPGEPVLIATAEGIAASSFYELFKARLSPSTIRHFGIAAYLAATLERDGEELLSERELLAHERAMAQRDFSLKLAGDHHHRPDMIALPAKAATASDWGRVWPSSSRTQGGRRGERTDVRDQGGRTEDAEMHSATHVIQPIAVELELTVKANDRLDRILTGWKAAVESGRFARARYFCAPGALGPVLRAVARVDALTAIDVLPLPAGIPGIAPLGGERIS
jgi:hypothetical protein